MYCFAFYLCFLFSGLQIDYEHIFCRCSFVVLFFACCVCHTSFIYFIQVLRECDYILGNGGCKYKMSGDAKSFFAVDLIFFVVFFVCFHVLRKDDLSLVGGG